MATAMSTGRLTEQVTVLRPPNWTVVASNVWAAVEYTTGNERIAGDQPISESHPVVTMRYRTDVAATMRLQWTPYQATTPKTLDISAVSPTSDRQWIVLDCSEVL
jgi:SPP1 family predicted phage head-tail adaptor